KLQQSSRHPNTALTFFLVFYLTYTFLILSLSLSLSLSLQFYFFSFFSTFFPLFVFVFVLPCPLIHVNILPRRRQKENAFVGLHQNSQRCVQCTLCIRTNCAAQRGCVPVFFVYIFLPFSSCFLFYLHSNIQSLQK